MTVIEMRDVGFGYSKDRLVLKDIDLRIDEPGLYSIVGPNGVGKSTMVKCLNRIVTPQNGAVLIDGNDISGMSYKELAKVVGFVPVFSNDVFSMSVVDTILVGCYNHTGKGSRERNLERVYEAMKLLDLEDLAYKRFDELSAGQHQKVAIARGLVQETPILILDEPTANLDVRYQVLVMELLRAISERKRLIVITISHDLNITAKYAHQVVMMSPPGIIYATGTPEEVFTRENIRKVYGVDCRVIMDDGGDGGIPSVPHVILGEALDEEGRS